jgi:hypothetical protein
MGKERPKGAAPSAARAALAAAIARAARLRSDLDTARDAAGRAKRRKWAAEAAAEALARAPEREDDLAERFISALASGGPSDVATLAPPRHRDDVALEHARAVEHWDKVERACEEVAADAESALSYAEREVATLADDILRAESAAFVGSLVAAAEKAQAELIEMRVALRFMVSNRLIADDALCGRARALLLAELPVAATTGSHSHKIFDAHPLNQQWVQAREALKGSADAMLPADAT